jgi:hypothetical protein
MDQRQLILTFLRLSAERDLRGVRPPRAGQGRGAAAREATVAPGPSGRGYGKISMDDAGAFQSVLDRQQIRDRSYGRSEQYSPTRADVTSYHGP